MADTRQKSETKKRRKALVVGSSAVVLVVGSIGCIQYVKTVLAKQAYYRRHDVKYSVKIYDAASEAKAEAERKKVF